MKAPTSKFGCFDMNCEACHGDEEWQLSRTECIYCEKQLISTTLEDVTIHADEDFNDECESPDSPNGLHKPRWEAE
jgi:hypothetical protein